MRIKVNKRAVIEALEVSIMEEKIGNKKVDYKLFCPLASGQFVIFSMGKDIEKAKSLLDEVLEKGYLDMSDYLAEWISPNEEEE